LSTYFKAAEEAVSNQIGEDSNSKHWKEEEILVSIRCSGVVTLKTQSH